MTAHLTPLLDAGKPPAEWVDALARRGIPISERTLREKANRLGACHKLGRAMLITPEQMDLILESGQPCPSKHTSEARHGGPKGGLSSTGNRSVTTIDAAREHLRKRAQRSGAPTKKAGSSVVTFSAPKKRNGR